MSKRTRSSSNTSGKSPKKQKIDPIDINGNQENYAKLVDIFLNIKFPSIDPNCKYSYHNADGNHDTTIEFKNGKTKKIDSIFLSISSEIFKERLKSNKTLNCKNFEIDDILPIFKWIYFKRFDAEKLTIKSMVAILKFSYEYKIYCALDSGLIIYLHQILEEFLRYEVLIPDYFYLIKLPKLKVSSNTDIYANMREIGLKKLADLINKFTQDNLRDCKNEKCCKHNSNSPCKNDLTNIHHCCIHIKNLIHKMVSKLSEDDFNKVFGKIRGMKKVEKLPYTNKITILEQMLNMEALDKH